MYCDGAFGGNGIAFCRLCYRDAVIENSPCSVGGTNREDGSRGQGAQAARARVMYVIRLRGSREVPPYCVCMYVYDGAPRG